MLPKKFEERMMALLGDKYEQFAAALEEAPVRAFRVNSLKCDGIDSVRDQLGENKIPYASDGYYLPEECDGIGNTPLHHAGAIYIQDPGAMASLCALPDPDALRGGRVCDLCSAPGGKSGQAAALIGEGGFILSNEFVPKRAKILVSNLERLGVKNAVVTSLDTAEIAKLYRAYFDLVIADAPCSGEGMFRKNGMAISEWSEENISQCAKRQSYILDNAAGLVRDGGYLLYSTCTYAIEENEMQIDAFLERHSDFELCPVNERLIKYTSDGISFDGAKSENLAYTRRFYPHMAAGEGQFVALLRRRTDDAPEILFQDSSVELRGEERKITEDFLKENLISTEGGKIIKYGNNIVLSLHKTPIPKSSIFSAGILIGEIRGKLLFPSHQLFSAMGKSFKRRLDIEDEVTAIKYLRGEEIPAKECSQGFAAVLYRGIALGGGKVSSGMLKNHYPKGLRVNR